jgi:hypothetical protein
MLCFGSIFLRVRIFSLLIKNPAFSSPSLLETLSKTRYLMELYSQFVLLRRGVDTYNKYLVVRDFLL